MTMFWIIVAIIIVGYFIVKAIQQQTTVNAQIALQQQELAKQQMENTPEYKRQRELSILYFEMLCEVTDNEIYAAKAKIRLIDAPSDTASKAAAKKRIAELEKYTKELQRDYEKTKAEYKGFNPEPVEATASKYGLDQTYSGDDWIRWDGQLGKYRDDQAQLSILRSRLLELERNGSSTSKDELVMAMRAILNNGEASTQVLTRELKLGWAEGRKMFERLQQKGLVSKPDKIFAEPEIMVSSLKEAQAKLD